MPAASLLAAIAAITFSFTMDIDLGNNEHNLGMSVFIYGLNYSNVIPST